MITDVFVRRYPNLDIIHHVDDRTRTFLFQAFHMIVTDLWLDTAQNLRDEGRGKALKDAHDKLAFELGKTELVSHHRKTGIPGQSVVFKGWEAIYEEFRVKPPSPYDSPNKWLAERISLIERVIAAFGDFKKDFDESFERKHYLAQITDKRNLAERTFVLPEEQAADLRTYKSWLDNRLDNIVSELNQRFQIARFPLEYHNGVIQQVHDPLISAQIGEPFWRIASGMKWANADIDMKNALNSRDAKIRDAHFPALKALESVIKIIAEDTNRTTGKENGAAAYIDDLVREVGGARFITVWEKDALVSLFSKVRNPHGHGAGSKPMPELSDVQTDWAINEAMNWIVSLIKRM